MKQRITFTAMIEVDAEGLDWAEASKLARRQVVQTDEAFFGRVIRIEIVEED